MFERYTEKARRVIFFGRYEASQFGSHYIETEHLLLGLLREDKRLTHLFLRSHVSVEEIRKKIEQHTIVREKVSTSVDLPLSNESKRVLAYASEEAERLAHKFIGTEHMLLGLLREKDGFAAHLLGEAGVALEDARKRIAEGVATATLGPGAPDIRSQSREVLEVRERVGPLKRFAWIKRDWKPIDVLVDQGTGRLHFDVSLDDPNFKLAGGAWARDWCALCNWELNTENPEHSTGYTNGRQWICPRCYRAFFDPGAKPETK